MSSQISAKSLPTICFRIFDGLWGGGQAGLYS
jgi:hypothetical protein